MVSSKDKLTKKSVGEAYMDILADNKEKFNKDKLGLIMQVGSFYEMYGIIKNDGTRIGNLWEMADLLNLKVAAKETKVEGGKLYMAGVPEANIQKYLQTIVERFGWTIVIYEQVKRGNTNTYDRVETAIYSPGINIDSSDSTNICMTIILEQISNKFNLQNKSMVNNKQDKISVGIAFVDSLTGNNGVFDVGTHNMKDTAIPFDEILKFLTIKKPAELIIHCMNLDISDQSLIDSLHLFKFNHKIIRDELDIKFEKGSYQRELLETVYVKHKGITNIVQQLELDDINLMTSRNALCVLLEYIQKHDKSVIQRLNKPDIIKNNNEFLMLANNCLEQLDIIDVQKKDLDNSFESGLGKRVCLYQLLNKCKTTMGCHLFKERLSNPITNIEQLQSRYQLNEELILTEQNYSVSSTDKFGSPMYKIRDILTQIKNVDNYFRKFVIQKINPYEVSPLIESLNFGLDLSFLLKQITKQNSNTSKYTQINNLIPSNKLTETIERLITQVNDTMIHSNCPRIWVELENNFFKEGVFKELDELQRDIDTDRNFVDELVYQLSKIISSDYKKNDEKQLIIKSDNAKLGLHLHTNTSRKDVLEWYFNQKKKINIGKYTIDRSCISFKKMKESKYQIDLPQLKISSGSLKANVEKLINLSKKYFKEWCHKIVLEYQESVKDMTKFISEVDVLQSIVYNSINNGYVKPNIVPADRSFVDAKDMRHPIIEKLHQSTQYIPNDICLGKTKDNNGNEIVSSDLQDGILLFGINAVGKSSCMKSVGINIIMAQAGMYVPCSSFNFFPYNYLFTRIKNNDNLYAGLSSFQVEMSEMKVILRFADKNSIILGDELCSGTETQDATALVASGVDILSRRHSNFIFATHLHFLADMPEIKRLENIKLKHLLVERDPKNPDKLIYTRKLQDGNGPKSYGILVCKSMDMDSEFIEMAEKIRHGLGTKKDISTVEVKSSKYNADKIITLCEVCNDGTVAEDVHHINEQNTADSFGIISNLGSNPELESGIFHKNNKWNLVSLCKKCHQDVHSVPIRLKINGYRQTNDGIELKYERVLEESQPPPYQEAEVVGNTEVYIETTSDKSNTYYLQNTTIIHLHEITDELKIQIKKYKEENISPKKIQIELKKKGVSISQKLIRCVD